MTRKPSLEVSPTTSAAFLAGQKFTQLILSIHSFKQRSAFLYYLLSALAMPWLTISAVAELVSSYDCEF